MRLRTFASRARDFLKNEDGVTTIEWLAVAGVALIMGVVMTWIATQGIGATGSYIEGNVNSAASNSVVSSIQ